MTRPSQPPDGERPEWIEAARGGDRAAVERLCRELGPDLSRYVASQMGGEARRWATPEDIVSQTLAETIRGLSKMPAGLGRDDLARRLRRTAKSRIIDAVNRNRMVGESRFGDEGLDPSADRDGTGTVTRRDTRRWLEEIFDEQPEPDRRIARLHALEGLDYDEIAAEVGLDREAVRKRYERLRERLKSRLGGRED